MLKSKFSRFCRADDGDAALEYMIIAPVVMTLFVGTMTIFDAYRAKFEAEAATNTIADLVSRETTTLTDDYIDGMLNVFETLSHRSDDEALRVSVVSYNADSQSHEVVWSQSRNSASGALTSAETQNMSDAFPLMGHLDRVVYLETSTDYVVPVGLMRDTFMDDFEIRNDIVITPRFASTVCYATGGADPYC